VLLASPFPDVGSAESPQKVRESPREVGVETPSDDQVAHLRGPQLEHSEATIRVDDAQPGL
jgi:hypothetical protein